MTESIGKEIENIENEIEACYTRIHQDSYISGILAGRYYLHPDEYREIIRERADREKDIISAE
jgi:hypothetical protein